MGGPRTVYFASVELEEVVCVCALNVTNLLSETLMELIECFSLSFLMYKSKGNTPPGCILSEITFKEMLTCSIRVLGVTLMRIDFLMELPKNSFVFR